MLKACVLRDQAKPVVVVKPVSEDVVFNCPYSPEADGLVDRNAQVSCGRLPNSAFLSNLELYLSYLHDKRSSVIELTRKYPGLFHDIPSQTTVVSHDIDVGECPPIKQHPYRVNPHKRQLMKNVVETVDEDSRDEGCFKNKNVFIEESPSAQTILKVFTQVFCWQIM